MKNKIVSTLAGILLAGSVAGCVTEPNYTGAAYALRNISASGKALNGKSLTYEDQQKILNGADYLDYQQQRHNTRKDMEKEHNFQREMQRDEHKFQRERDNSSRREYAPDKEFYTALCKDSNRNGKITGDECLIKKNSFSNDETFAILLTDRASHKGTKSSIDVYDSNNAFLEHLESIKSADIVDRGSPVGSSVQIDVYCPNGNLAVTSKSLYKKSSPLQEDISGVGLPDVLVNNCGYGKYRVTRKTNGVLDGEIDFHILSEDKSYL